jgi:hypothetical protein
MFAESWHTAVGLLRIAHDARAGRQEFDLAGVSIDGDHAALGVSDKVV